MDLGLSPVAASADAPSVLDTPVASAVVDDSRGCWRDWGVGVLCDADEYRHPAAAACTLPVSWVGYRIPLPSGRNVEVIVVPASTLMRIDA
jgi:hypothetical protein